MEENPLEWKAIRILEDAGCDEETVRRYCELEAYQGRQSIACKEQIRLLRKPTRARTAPKPCALRWKPCPRARSKRAIGRPTQSPDHGAYRATPGLALRFPAAFKFPDRHGQGYFVGGQYHRNGDVLGHAAHRGAYL